MSIEDVQYLLQNSVKESITFFVDSSTRDRVHYPTPSQYVVTLDDPVRNVFGLEVLDAAIPNSMYNVDAYNNHLRTLLVDSAASGAMMQARGEAAATDVPSIDQCDMAFLNSELFKLGQATPLRSWISDQSRATYRLAVLDETEAGSIVRLSPLSTQPPFTPTAGETYNFAIVQCVVASRVQLLASTCPSSVSISTSTIQQQQQQQQPGAPLAVFNGMMYRALDAAGEAALLAVSGGQPGSFVIVPSNPCAPTSSSSYDVLRYTGAALPNSGQLDDLTGSGRARLALTVQSTEVEVGNYSSLPTLSASLQDALTGCGIVVGSTTDSGITKQSIYTLSTPPNARLLLSPTDSSISRVIGFDLTASVKDNTSVPWAWRSSNAVQVGGDMAQVLFASKLAADGSAQVLTAPGMANLLGVRYVTLRCPEIEQHVGRPSRDPTARASVCSSCRPPTRSASCASTIST